MTTPEYLITKIKKKKVDHVQSHHNCIAWISWSILPRITLKFIALNIQYRFFLANVSKIYHQNDPNEQVQIKKYSENGRAHLRSNSAMLSTCVWLYWTSSENKNANALELTCKTRTLKIKTSKLSQWIELVRDRTTTRLPLVCPCWGVYRGH